MGAKPQWWGGLCPPPCRWDQYLKPQRKLNSRATRWILPVRTATQTNIIGNPTHLGGRGGTPHATTRHSSKWTIILVRQAKGRAEPSSPSWFSLDEPRFPVQERQWVRRGSTIYRDVQGTGISGAVVPAIWCKKVSVRTDLRSHTTFKGPTKIEPSLTDSAAEADGPATSSPGGEVNLSTSSKTLDTSETFRYITKARKTHYFASEPLVSSF